MYHCWQGPWSRDLRPEGREHTDSLLTNLRTQFKTPVVEVLTDHSSMEGEDNLYQSVAEDPNVDLYPEEDRYDKFLDVEAEDEDLVCEECEHSPESCDCESGFEPEEEHHVQSVKGKRGHAITLASRDYPANPLMETSLTPAQASSLKKAKYGSKHDGSFPFVPGAPEVFRYLRQFPKLTPQKAINVLRTAANYISAQERAILESEKKERRGGNRRY